MPKENVIPPALIKEVALEEEMKESYLTFAMSVIVSRALPDVRDGLKPAQRRILFAMHELNLGPSAQFRKCASIVGETMGNYHPHGELVIYPTLARMAQEWNARYPLVDGHGNFGSVDGDPPGAMRYTEARMSALTAEMLRDIERETVDFVPNFDQRHQEPTVLPAFFPNLLCNGSSGIAVGMATNIPPHNLGEVVDAAVMLIDNEDTTVADLMQAVPGPDFPTGGIVFGRQGIVDAYHTGRGSITMQARATIEPIDGGKTQILVTELPYMVNKARLVEQIADLVRDKRIEGIGDLRDESDRTGMRLVIEIKRDADPNVILNQLYKHTPMRTTFGANMLALVDGAPKTLNLRDMLRFYLDHREIVARRRAEFDLRKAKDRAHILEGYRIALDHLDEVIETIRKSKDPATARERLQKRFELSERQAQAILELMLQRLTNMEREKIEEEYRQIIKTIAYLEDLLSNRRKLMQVVRGELLELKEKHGDPRRTVIRAEEVGEISIEDLIAEEDVVITITRDGYIKRLPVDTYRTQGRGGKGVIALTPREQDAVEHLFISNTHQYILFFTDRGKVYRLRAHEVPPASRQARGIAVINLIRIEPGENIAAVRPIKEFTPEWHLFMATEQGVVKKTSLDAFDTRLKGGLIAINLAENDNLRWVVCTDGAQEIILATRHGMAIRFSEKEVRAMGRTAAGVRGIRLRTGDQVVGMALVEEDIEVLVATHHGYGKRTPAADYRAQSRGGIGLKTMQITPKNGPLVAVRTVRPEDEVMLITDAGQIIRQRVGDIRKTGRSTQGVRLMRLDEGDHIANLARVLVPEEEEE